MIIKKQLIKRSIAGDIILVPVGKTVYDTKGLFVMNEIGGFIWDLIPDAENEDQIIQAILGEYDVSEEKASEDVHAFLAKLQTMGIL